MKKVGVPETPFCLPSAKLLLTTEALSPLSKQLLNLLESKPKSTAYCFKFDISKACWFWNNLS